MQYRGTADRDWRWAEEGSVKVAGISLGTRAVDFLSLACVNDFKMYLEDEPDNPVNTHARQVMACATVSGTCVSKHLGYLPDEIATKYAGVELDISPKSAFLPPSPDLNLGLEVALRERSARYMKRAPR